MTDKKRILVLPACIKDLDFLAYINQECFAGNADIGSAFEWLKARFLDPVFDIRVAEIDGAVAGYIVWEIKGGWNRKKPVVELEQLAVGTQYRNQGVASTLVEQSLPSVGTWVRNTNKHCCVEPDTVETAHVNHATIIVWTAEDNPVNKIYRKFFHTMSGSRRQYGRQEHMLLGVIPLPPPKSE
ncbi:MAG TPA: GNAT family N-acetyltransferase [Candidatus Paceibacterota bacterium]